MSQTLEIHQFTGEVDEFEAPTGSGPYRIVLGVESGQYRNPKKFIAWSTDYSTKEPNAFIATLQAAHQTRDAVTVSYFTKTKQGQKGPYPQNTITDVQVVGGGAPSSPPSTEGGWGAPSSPPTVPSGAPATSIDNNKFVAGQLRASAADLNNYADLLEGK